MNYITYILILWQAGSIHSKRCKMPLCIFLFGYNKVVAYIYLFQCSGVCRFAQRMWLRKTEQSNSDAVTSCEEPVLLKQYLVLFYGAFDSGLFVEKNSKMRSNKKQKNWNRSTLNLMKFNVIGVFIHFIGLVFIVAVVFTCIDFLYTYYYNSVVCCLVSDSKKEIQA